MLASTTAMSTCLRPGAIMFKYAWPDPDHNTATILSFPASSPSRTNSVPGCSSSIQEVRVL